MKKKPQHAAPKKSFCQRWFPCRGDRPGTVVLKILTILFLVVFLVSGYFLLDELVMKPTAADQSVEELRQEFFPSESESSESSQTDESTAESTVQPDPAPTPKPIDYAKQLATLQERYPDIVGWIQLPGTIIDYPVLQSDSSDPEYYLYRNYKSESTKYGSIFASSDSLPFAQCRNSVVYGHSMQDGRMFASLLFFSSLDTYRTCPTITLYTEEGKNTWKIFSVMKVSTKEEHGKYFPFSRTSFLDDDDFMQYVYGVYQRSVLDTGVTVREDDELLSLVTCSYEYDGFRTVVVARKVRDGESSEVDTSKSRYNARVVYPDVWYTNHSGSQPVWTENWHDAVKDGSFSGYDGNG